MRGLSHGKSSRCPSGLRRFGNEHSGTLTPGSEISRTFEVLDVLEQLLTKVNALVYIPRAVVALGYPGTAGFRVCRLVQEWIETNEKNV